MHRGAGDGEVGILGGRNVGLPLPIPSPGPAKHAQSQDAELPEHAGNAVRHRAEVLGAGKHGHGRFERAQEPPPRIGPEPLGRSRLPGDERFHGGAFALRETGPARSLAKAPGGGIGPGLELEKGSVAPGSDEEVPGRGREGRQRFDVLFAADGGLEEEQRLGSDAVERGVGRGARGRLAGRRDEPAFGNMRLAHPAQSLGRKAQIAELLARYPSVGDEASQIARALPIRQGPDAEESEDMIDAVTGIIRVRLSQALQPETVALGRQRLPVVDREAPVLAEMRIHIRRSPRDEFQTEGRTPHPHIGGILVHQDGNVAHERDAALREKLGGFAELPGRPHLKPCPESQRRRPERIGPEPDYVPGFRIAEIGPVPPGPSFVAPLGFDEGCIGSHPGPRGHPCFQLRIASRDDDLRAAFELSRSAAGQGLLAGLPYPPQKLQLRRIEFFVRHALGVAEPPRHRGGLGAKRFDGRRGQEGGAFPGERAGPVAARRRGRSSGISAMRRYRGWSAKAERAPYGEV